MGRAVARLRRREMLALAVAVVGLGLLARLMSVWPRTGMRSRWSGLAEAIWTTLRENGVDQEGRIDELTALLETRADVGLIGRLALGRHWNRLPEAQRQEYEELFRAVVIRSLARRLDDYAADAQGALEDRFRILGSGPRASSIPWSAPRCFRPRAAAGAAGACARAASGPVIIDLIVEGASLLVSQRSSSPR